MGFFWYRKGRQRTAPTGIAIRVLDRRARWQRRSRLLSLFTLLSVGATGFARADQGTVSTGIVGADTTLATASPTFSQFDRVHATQSDVVFGHDTAGPYLLSWKGVRAASETVVRNNVMLQRNVDYQFDETGGTVTFTLPLKSGDMARVTYACDTAEAKPNETGAPQPLVWDVWQSGKNSVALRTVIAAPAASTQTAGTTPATTTSLLFQSGARLARTSDLSTALFLNMDGGDVWARNALKVAEHTRVGVGEFALTYAHAGTGFLPSGSNAPHAGEDDLEATGSLALLKGLTLDANGRITDDLADPTRKLVGSTTEQYGNTLTYLLPHHEGKIVAGRTETLTSQPGSATTTQVGDSLKVQKSLVKGTDATVTYDATTTTTPATGAGTGTAAASGSYQQTTGLDIQSQVNDRLRLTGNFTNVLGQTAADKTAIGLDTNPIAKFPKLHLTADWKDRYQSDGVYRDRNAMLELPIFRYMDARLAGGFQLAGAPGKELMTRILRATAHPQRYLDVTGTAQFRDGTVGQSASNPDAVDGYDMKMTLEPAKKVQFTGNLARNPAASDGTVQHTNKQGVGLETDLGFVRLHGQYSVEDQYLANTLSNNLDVGIDLRFSRFDTLSTGYQEKSTQDQSLSGSLTYLLAFTHKLGQAFDLTLGGSMTVNRLNNQLQWDTADMKAEARVGLRF